MRGLRSAPGLALLLASCAGGGEAGPASPPPPTSVATEPAAASTNRPRPNVLLVVVDTLRADRLGSYGFDGPTTPRLDALAASGVRVERFYTAAPSTLASFTSMLNGRYPHTHGVYRNGTAWPAGLEGMPSVFAAGGYETAGFVASYCLTSIFGVDRGFDHFDENLTLALPDLPSNKLIRLGADVTDSVVRWLDQRQRDAPFFAMAHYFDPHWPYRPPAGYAELFGPGYEGPIRGGIDDLMAMRSRLIRSAGRPDRDTEQLHALHLGEIRYTDDQIARLLSALGGRGLLENTLVVVTADHGEGIYEHGDFFNHGLTVYDTNIRVPLILSGPALAAAGTVVSGPYSNVDLAPTLLDYAGLPIPESFEGRSFLRVLDGAAPPDGEPGPARDLFAEATKPHTVEAGQAWPNRLKARCVIRGAYKLVRWPFRLNAPAELYHLLDDPGELRNLLEPAAGSAAPARARELDEALEIWSGRTPEALPERPETDPDVMERLRSLGYVR